jgi:two-component system, chemotaxis family, sensor kinase CheA
MNEELYNEFSAEATVGIQEIMGWLVAASLGDRTGSEEARRNAHSIKGAGRMVGATDAADMAGLLEDILHEIAVSEEVDPSRVDDALALCAEIGEAVESVVSEEPPTEPTDLPLVDDAVDDDPGLHSVMKLLPDIPRNLLEGLSSFACDEVRRLVGDGRHFWVVRAETTLDTMEADLDSVREHLVTQGEVVAQTVSVSTTEGYDFSASSLFASNDSPVFPAGFPVLLTTEPLELQDVTIADTSEKSDTPPQTVIEQPHADAEPDSASDLADVGVTQEELQEIFLQTADNLMQELTESITNASRSPDSSEALDALFRAGHSLKGTGGSFGFPIISRLGHEMESVLDRVRRRQIPLNQALIDVLYDCMDTVQGICDDARDGTLDQNAELPVLDQLRNVAEGREVVDGPAVEISQSEVSARSSLGQSMRLTVEAADRLLDLGRDTWLAVEEASFLLPPEGEQRDSIERARGAILGLVDSILATRMQTVGQIFQAFPRLVRQISQKQDKRIKMEITGEEVKMDRLMLEAVNDPLVHLVRNALDHGIESPAERELAGKDPTGLVKIECTADRDTVTIEVSDDGNGIDTAKLKEKAVATGRITEEAAEALTEAQALELMFMAGLTSREAVSEISGRGVGMDVVSSNVEQIRGTVEISSQTGEGTSIRLRLPLTAAMLRVVEVEVAGVSLCIPTPAVDRVVTVRSSTKTTEIKSPGGLTEIVPLVSASRYLDGSASSEGDEAVILRDHSQVLGLLVNRVVDERPVLVTDLGRLIDRTRWAGACTLMADGQVAPILDTSAILQEFSGIGSLIDERPEEPEPDVDMRATALPRILAVDDSPTMRQLLKNVLELAGYEVSLTPDGLGALSELSRSLPDLVLTDVNMPGMDGLQLVREIRKKWKDLPVAIVSGRDRHSDRQAGMDAGANAYIVKGAADRRGLLSTVARLLSFPSREND